MISSANKWDSSNINLWFSFRTTKIQHDAWWQCTPFCGDLPPTTDYQISKTWKWAVKNCFYSLLLAGWVPKKTQWKNSTPTFPFPFCLSSYIHQLDKISTCFMDIWTASPCLVSGVFALFVPLLRWLSSSHHISNGRVLAEKNMKRCRHCFLVQESSN